MILNTLRGRLIASHIIPMLVTVPIMGIALIYGLGNQVVLDEASRQLTRQAVLVAELVKDRPDIWQDPTTAQRFVDHVNPGMGMNLELLDASGRVLASSDLTGEDTLSQSMQATPVARTHYSERLQTMVADVIVPVIGPNQHVIGAVRLTDQLASSYGTYQRVRYLVVAILLTGFLLSAALGWVLALDLQRPLQQVTQAVLELSDGQRLQALPHQGIRDIALLTEAFNTLSERLRASERNRHQLLANVTHELGRPLGALHSAVQALLNGADKDVQFRRELLSGMDEELQSLRRHLKDLTLLDRRSVPSSELKCHPTEFCSWLLAVLAPRHVLALDKGIDWEMHIPTNLPTLNMDPVRMGQALGNLLHNAIQYTPPGGKIIVSAGVQEDTAGTIVWVRVSDSGPGMTPEEQQHVFEPFFRGNSLSCSPQGMGLGLTIARDLVTAHGGHLTLESAPGAGSSFTIRLPVQIEPYP
ncbi:MAG: HAMP domain-containing histidine kinase [Chloroflexi bacterium]|nr:HAMP domain-containing histidine kinase [Chloroflexota bacterium]